VKDDEVRAEIPTWVGGTGQYAIIRVQYEPGGGEAWPVVQRVPGGWQSGAHHYPDDAVLSVRPLTLVDPGDTRPIVQRVAEHLLTHAIDTTDRDADGNCACVCGNFREGDPSVCEGWDDHLAESLADAGLLADR
jgi:hypothetical protein